MTWMFRWLSGLLSHLHRADGGTSNAWVEPSNAITRAILSGAVAELPPLPLEQAPGEIVPMTQKPAAPATRTAQRVRRRRAGRAA